MKSLIILDYSTASAHLYDVADSVAVNEEYISNLGFHTSECEWMIGNNIEVNVHKGVLR